MWSGHRARSDRRLRLLDNEVQGLVPRNCEWSAARLAGVPGRFSGQRCAAAVIADVQVKMEQRGVAGARCLQRCSGLNAGIQRCSCTASEFSEGAEGTTKWDSAPCSVGRAFLETPQRRAGRQRTTGMVVYLGLYFRGKGVELGRAGLHS